MRVFISAGEPSGDDLGARLLRALRVRRPDVEAWGIGGPKLRDEGLEAIHETEALTTHGLVEVVGRLPALRRILTETSKKILAARPDVVVLVDFQDFHLRLAERLRGHGLKVVLMAAPSVWAWRSWRKPRYVRAFDRILVLFRFEEAIWKGAGAAVTWVGHPRVDDFPPPLATVDPRCVALLPGSRDSEIQRHADLFFRAARGLVERGVADSFVLPVAAGLDPSFLRERRKAHGLERRLRFTDRVHDHTIGAASAAIVASGTATLEMALWGRPQVIAYRMNPLTTRVVRSLLRRQHVGLPNILLGRSAVPEVLGSALTAERLVDETERLIVDEDARTRAIEAAREVTALVGPRGAADRAAKAVLEVSGVVSAARAPTTP